MKEREQFLYLHYIKRINLIKYNISDFQEFFPKEGFFPRKDGSRGKISFILDRDAFRAYPKPVIPPKFIITSSLTALISTELINFASEF